ncbi:MAG: hypothetical protein HYW25_02390 [Candidatus Aenigmarchaeota archaeon]|nr:hypothetical protein [Candidatus Aenigmarchaeota archaeon]
MDSQPQEGMKPSVVVFECLERNGRVGKGRIECRIPELREWERLVLNAWGIGDGHYRWARGLGIYAVASKRLQRDGRMVYDLGLEREYSDEELAHSLLSGNGLPVQEETRGLRYLKIEPIEDGERSNFMPGN